VVVLVVGEQERPQLPIQALAEIRQSHLRHKVIAVALVGQDQIQTRVAVEVAALVLPVEMPQHLQQRQEAGLEEVVQQPPYLDLQQLMPGAVEAVLMLVVQALVVQAVAALALLLVAAQLQGRQILVGVVAAVLEHHYSGRRVGQEL
jgi:hypothetical protein